MSMDECGYGGKRPGEMIEQPDNEKPGPPSYAANRPVEQESAAAAPVQPPVSGAREWPGAINGETFDKFVERIFDMVIRGKDKWIREDLQQFARNYAAAERERCAELDKLLHYVVLAVCDPHKAVKGEMPTPKQAVTQIIDRMLTAETALAEAQANLEQSAEQGDRLIALGHILTDRLAAAETERDEQNKVACDFYNEIKATKEQLAEAQAALLKTVWHQRAQFPDDPYCILCGVGFKWSQEYGHNKSCVLYTASASLPAATQPEKE